MNIRNLIVPVLLAAGGAAVISLAPLAQADATPPPAAAPAVVAFTAPAVGHVSAGERGLCPGGGEADPSTGQCDPNRCPSGSSPGQGEPAGTCDPPAGEPHVRRG
jgi:hypothetical protein